MISPSTDTETVQLQILDAAEARFRRFGYGKTTMAEIAGDVAMSAANLYRYFDNKQDIAAACAIRCMGQGTALLREVVQRPGLDAAQRLETFVLTMVRYSHEQAAQHPRINELVNIIASQRQELVHDKNRAQCELIADILRQGHASGEFDVVDVEATAAAVYTTLPIFQVPIFMQLYSLEEFEKMAHQVVKLLVRGLARR